MKPRLAVTLGDPRGIGPEITRAALQDPLDASITLVGPDDLIEDIPAAHRVGTGTWGLGSGDRADHARTVRAGRLAGHAVETAARMALAGEVDAIVTAPANKHALHLAGFPYPGHTEWLAELCGGVDVAMMLASDRLRVVLVTTHVALRDVPALLTVERIGRVARTTSRALREWWGISEPRLALCALKPARRRIGTLWGRGAARPRSRCGRVESCRSIPGGHRLRARAPGRVRLRSSRRITTWE